MTGEPLPHVAGAREFTRMSKADQMRGMDTSMHKGGRDEKLVCKLLAKGCKKLCAGNCKKASDCLLFCPSKNSRT